MVIIASPGLSGPAYASGGLSYGGSFGGPAYVGGMGYGVGGLGVTSGMGYGAGYGMTANRDEGCAVSVNPAAGCAATGCGGGAGACGGGYTTATMGYVGGGMGEYAKETTYKYVGLGAGDH